ncbi:hypothetical protein Tco_0098537 [Tanacetum coccineum]
MDLMSLYQVAIHSWASQSFGTQKGSNPWWTENQFQLSEHESYRLLRTSQLLTMKYGYLKDGDGDGNSPHKGVKASANSDIMYFFTSAQDGDPLQDDVRLCLGDDLKKAQDHSQRQV